MHNTKFEIDPDGGGGGGGPSSRQVDKAEEEKLKKMKTSLDFLKDNYNYFPSLIL